MMTNVKLSKLEMDLVTDGELILTKNRIIQKVYELFGELSEKYIQIKNNFPAEVLSVSPKISKGENYKGLPWVMLDYPRAFSNTDVFAIRTFFWWGNFFSIALQLQGRYKDKYEASINKYLKSCKDGWYRCINENDPWQHHFEAENFQPVSSKELIEALPFIKVAKKIPLSEWESSSQFLSDSYKEIIKMLCT
jgi:hypothetical protein